MKALITLGLALVALPASAQSVAGIRFGDTLESVRPRFAGTYNEVDDTPGAAFINRSTGYIWFCNGRVTSMQETIGDDLHAFTDTIVELTRDHGEPKWLARNVRSSGGEISTMNARWVLPTYGVTIGYLYNADKLDVTRTYDTTDTCVANRLP